jgi:epoxyqueuosine reductase QueG
MDLTAKVKELALERLDLVGISATDQFDSAPHGRKPTDLLPGARSVVVVGHELNRPLTDALTVTRQVGEVLLRKVFDGHVDAVNRALNDTTHQIGRLLGRHGYAWMAVPTDGITDARTLTAIFSFKHAAMLSGLGRFGKHALIITPQFGPRQRFAAILTSAELAPTAPGRQADPCEECRVCIEICPPRALQEAPDDQPYAVDRFRCQAFNSGSGGCGLCMSRCPAGKGAGQR